MTREDAYEMIRMLRQFEHDCPGLTIDDLIPTTDAAVAEGSDPQTRLRFPDRSVKVYTDWYAAKVIEANSDNE